MSLLSRLRAAAGLVGALLLLLSSAAHGIAGWQHMAGRLGALGAPDDLQLGLRLGWQLGSLAMIVFGLLAGRLCWRRWQGQRGGGELLALLAVGYGGYGLWAFVVSGGEPGFVVFLAPAVLIALAIPDSKLAA